MAAVARATTMAHDGLYEELAAQLAHVKLEAQEELFSLRNAVAAERKRRLDAESLAAARAEQVGDLQRRANELNWQLSDALSTINALDKGDTSVILDRCTEAQALADSLQQERAALLTENDALLERINQLGSQAQNASSLEEENMRLAALIAAVTEERDDARDQFRAQCKLSKEAQWLRDTDRQEFEQRLEGAHLAAAAQLAALQAVLDAERVEVVRLQQVAAQAAADAASTRVSAQATNQQLQAKYDSACEQLASLTQSCGQLRAELSTSTATCQSLVAVVDSLRSELTRLRAKEQTDSLTGRVQDSQVPASSPSHAPTSSSFPPPLHATPLPQASAPGSMHVLPQTASARRLMHRMRSPSPGPTQTTTSSTISTGATGMTPLVPITTDVVPESPLYRAVRELVRIPETQQPQAATAHRYQELAQTVSTLLTGLLAQCQGGDDSSPASAASITSSSVSDVLQSCAVQAERVSRGIEGLKAARDEVSRQLQTRNAEVEALQRQHNDATSGWEAAQQRYAQLQQEFAAAADASAQLQAQLKDIHFRYQQLESAHAQVTAALLEQQGFGVSTSEQVQVLTAECASMQAHVSSLTTALQHTQGEAQQAREQATSVLTELEQERTERNALVQRYESTVSALQEEVAGALEAYATLQSDAASATFRVNELEHSLTDSNASIVAVGDELQAANRQAAALNEQASWGATEIIRLQQCVADVQADADSRATELRRELDEVRTQLREAHSQLASCTHAGAMAAEQHDSLRSSLEQLTEQKELAVHAHFDATAARMESLKAGVASGVEERGALVLQLQQAQAHAAALESRLASTQAQHASQTAALKQRFKEFTEEAKATLLAERGVMQKRTEYIAGKMSEQVTKTKAQIAEAVHAAVTNLEAVKEAARAEGREEGERAASSTLRTSHTPQQDGTAPPPGAYEPVNLQMQTAAVQSAVAAVREQLGRRHEQQLTQLRAEHVEATARLQEQLHALQQQWEQLQSRCQSAEDQVGYLNGELESQMAECTRLLSEVSRLGTALEQAEQQSEDNGRKYASNLAGASSQLTELMAALHSLHEEKQQVQAEVLTLQADKEANLAALAAAQGEAERQSATVEQLQHQLVQKGAELQHHLAQQPAATGTSTADAHPLDQQLTAIASACTHALSALAEHLQYRHLDFDTDPSAGSTWRPRVRLLLEGALGAHEARLAWDDLLDQLMEVAEAAESYAQTYAERRVSASSIPVPRVATVDSELVQHLQSRLESQEHQLAASASDLLHARQEAQLAHDLTVEVQAQAADTLHNLQQLQQREGSWRALVDRLSLVRSADRGKVNQLVRRLKHVSYHSLQALVRMWSRLIIEARPKPESSVLVYAQASTSPLPQEWIAASSSANVSDGNAEEQVVQLEAELHTLQQQLHHVQQQLQQKVQQSMAANSLAAVSAPPPPPVALTPEEHHHHHHHHAGGGGVAEDEVQAHPLDAPQAADLQAELQPELQAELHSRPVEAPAMGIEASASLTVSSTPTVVHDPEVVKVLLAELAEQEAEIFLLRSELHPSSNYNSRYIHSATKGLASSGGNSLSASVAKAAVPSADHSGAGSVPQPNFALATTQVSHSAGASPQPEGETSDASSQDALQLSELLTHQARAEQQQWEGEHHRSEASASQQEVHVGYAALDGTPSGESELATPASAPFDLLAVCDSDESAWLGALQQQGYALSLHSQWLSYQAQAYTAPPFSAPVAECEVWLSEQLSLARADAVGAALAAWESGDEVARDSISQEDLYARYSLLYTVVSGHFATLRSMLMPTLAVSEEEQLAPSASSEQQRGVFEGVTDSGETHYGSQIQEVSHQLGMGEEAPHDQGSHVGHANAAASEPLKPLYIPHHQPVDAHGTTAAEYEAQLHERARSKVADGDLGPEEVSAWVTQQLRDWAAMLPTPTPAQLAMWSGNYSAAESASSSSQGIGVAASSNGESDSISVRSTPGVSGNSNSGFPDMFAPHQGSPKSNDRRSLRSRSRSVASLSGVSVGDSAGIALNVGPHARPRRRSSLQGYGSVSLYPPRASETSAGASVGMEAHHLANLPSIHPTDELQGFQVPSLSARLAEHTSTTATDESQLPHSARCTTPTHPPPPQAGALFSTPAAASAPPAFMSASAHSNSSTPTTGSGATRQRPRYAAVSLEDMKREEAKLKEAAAKKASEEAPPATLLTSFMSRFKSKGPELSAQELAAQQAQGWLQPVDALDPHKPPPMLAPASPPPQATMNEPHTSSTQWSHSNTNHSVPPPHSDAKHDSVVSAGLDFEGDHHDTRNEERYPVDSSGDSSSGNMSGDHDGEEGEYMEPPPGMVWISEDEQTYLLEEATQYVYVLQTSESGEMGAALYGQLDEANGSIRVMDPAELAAAIGEEE